MKKHNPDVMIPDKGTEVLAYIDDELGFVVASYDGIDWIEAWSEEYMADTPEYWVDLEDIENIENI